MYERETISILVLFVICAQPKFYLDLDPLNSYSERDKNFLTALIRKSN